MYYRLSERTRSSLHRNRAGRLTLNIKDICRKAKASAGNGGRLHVASSFPPTADEPMATSSQSVQPPAAEQAPPQPATEKKRRLPFKA